MYLRLSKLGSIFCLIYFILFLLAFIYARFTINESPLAAIYIMILTFPWSYITTALLFFLNIIDTMSTSLKLIISIIFAIINASILYYLFDKYEKEETIRRQKAERP